MEFAIIAPIVLVMLGGLFEVGHAFQALTAADELASQYAISWADCLDNPTGTCNTEIGLYTPSAAIANIAPQLTSANVGLQMFQVNMSGTTPNITYSYASNGASTLSASQIAAAQAALTSGQNGVIVTVAYTYTVSVFPGVLSGIIPSTIPMSFTVCQLKA